MGQYYLAVDIGASSGRHILGSLKDDKLVLEEIYRFENGLEKKDGHLCWDLTKIFTEIKNGLKKCKELNKIPVSMGIDTWGVDYVLLDKNNQVLGKTYGYRDHRTTGMDTLVYDKIPQEELYKRTGIQKQIFNSIYQLMAVKEQEPEIMEAAEDFIMIPDYFHFLLTGEKCSEYTNATTTQLVNAQTKDWDYELIDLLGYKKEIFKKLSLPKTFVGNFTDEIANEVGFSCKVILPATHDTGSAVISVPANDDDFLYISSGTWSLMGIEGKAANCTLESMEKNFTNEGGYDYRFRYLKNIMGLWMIQSVRHELEDAYSFARLCEMAMEEDKYSSRVDVNDECFLSPENMTEEINSYLRKTNQEVPKNIGQLASCIYQSLAKSYKETVKEIENITGRTYSRIHIIGGGANAAYLNELTAKKTGKEVYAGPVEATAIGNLVCQLLGAGEYKTLEEARTSIYNSFNVKRV